MGVFKKVAPRKTAGLMTSKLLTVTSQLILLVLVGVRVGLAVGEHKLPALVHCHFDAFDGGAALASPQRFRQNVVDVLVRFFLFEVKFVRNTMDHMVLKLEK